MKVVLNVGIGGFSLSEKAALLCIERGIPLRDWDEARDEPCFMKPDDEDARYYGYCSDERLFRAHPTIVQVVEELGEAADGESATLAVLEVPFSEPCGWYIHESEEGIETIHESHRAWYWQEGATEEF